MQVNIINNLLSSFQHVTKTMLNKDVKIIHKTSKNIFKNQSGIISNINFYGNFEGQIVFSSNIDTFNKLVSGMMGGRPVNGIDDITKSAFGELTNMVMGSFCSNCLNQGNTINISPPTIITGLDVEVTTKDLKTIALTIELEGIGPMEVGIGL